MRPNSVRSLKSIQKFAKNLIISTQNYDHSHQTEINIFTMLGSFFLFWAFDHINLVWYFLCEFCYSRVIYSREQRVEFRTDFAFHLNDDQGSKAWLVFTIWYILLISVSVIWLMLTYILLQTAVTFAWVSIATTREHALEDVQMNRNGNGNYHNQKMHTRARRKAINNWTKDDRVTSDQGKGKYLSEGERASRIWKHCS